MRAFAAWAGALFPSATRGVALFAFGCAGCSLLLAHDATQCSVDADCEALGLHQSTCDVAAKVCKSSAGGAGPGSGGKASSAGASAASANGGGNDSAGDGGMPDGGTAQGGGASLAGAPQGGSEHFAGSGGSISAGGKGAGGSSGSGAAGAGAAGAPPIPDWKTVQQPAQGVLVRVRSFCSGSLWLHLANGSVVLTPDSAELTSGKEQDYNAPANWTEARITAYGLGPSAGMLDKIDVSVSGGTTNYTLQYLDGLGLPMEVEGFGGSCTADQVQSCTARQSEVATCPHDFLRAGGRCLSASVYCQVPANQGSPYCHALDTAIASCSACPKGSTVQAYAGIGPYSDGKFGAALNRGTTADLESTDPAKFYKQPPFNTYAAWAHKLCPNVLSFPTDYYGATGVIYPNCTAKELRVTLCPAR